MNYTKLIYELLNEKMTDWPSSPDVRFFQVGTYVEHAEMPLPSAVMAVPCDGGGEGEAAADAGDSRKEAFVKDMMLLLKKTSWKYLEMLFDELCALKKENVVPLLVKRYCDGGFLQFDVANGCHKPCWEVMCRHGFFHMTDKSWNRIMS